MDGRQTEYCKCRIKEGKIEQLIKEGIQRYAVEEEGGETEEQRRIRQQRAASESPTRMPRSNLTERQRLEIEMFEQKQQLINTRKKDGGC